MNPLALTGVSFVDFVVTLVADGVGADGARPAGIHDVADGGLGVALAEMAVRSGIGVTVAGVDGHAALWSEAASRVVVCAAPDAAQAIFRAAGEAGVPATFLGGSGGDRFVVQDLVDVELATLADAWRRVIPAAVGAGNA